MSHRSVGALVLTLTLAPVVACAGDDASGDTSAASASASASTSASASASASTATDGTSAGTSASSASDTGGACPGEAQHSGDGTYYAADGSGNCSFPATPQDLMVAAMNAPDYGDSAPCGACARVTGPGGSGPIVVRVVDSCPGCAGGDLDLSPQAFELLAPLEEGRIDITWEYVPCPVDGDLRYHFKEGSSQWWTAVQVRNHRNAIATFEYSKDGQTFVPVARESYNYFVAPEGMGPDPVTFRVTDVHGAVIVDGGLVVGDNVEVAGAAGNFPSCAP